RHELEAHDKANLGAGEPLPGGRRKLVLARGAAGDHAGHGEDGGATSAAGENRRTHDVTASVDSHTAPRCSGQMWANERVGRFGRRPSESPRWTANERFMDARLKDARPRARPE